VINAGLADISHCPRQRAKNRSFLYLTVSSVLCYKCLEGLIGSSRFNLIKRGWKDLNFGVGYRAKIYFKEEENA
jgi:hypothetical protein